MNFGVSQLPFACKSILEFIFNFQVRIPMQFQTTYFHLIIYKKNFINFVWDIELCF